MVTNSVEVLLESPRAFLERERKTHSALGQGEKGQRRNRQGSWEEEGKEASHCSYCYERYEVGMSADKVTVSF